MMTLLLEWIDLSLRATALISLVALATLTWKHRRTSASARHFALSAAFLTLLALPWVGLLMPQEPLAWLPAPTPADEAALERFFARDEQAASGTNESQTTEGASRPDPPGLRLSTGPDQELSLSPRDSQWPGAIFGVWLAVSLALLLRLVFGWRRLTQLTRSGRELPPPLDEVAERQILRLGLRKPVLFRLSDEIREPMAFVASQATVLLPSDVIHWPVEELELAMAHELAHLDRLDPQTHLVAQLACALYWHLPWVWWLAARQRHERELACDDRVLATGQKGLDYAGRLVAIARRLPRHSPLGSTAVALTRDGFRRRLDALLDAGRCREVASRRFRGATALVLLAMTTGLGAVSSRSEAPWRQILDCGDCPTASLLSSLESPDPGLRIAALKGLVERAEKSTFYVILEKRQDQDPEIRAAAVMAHAAIGCEPALASVTLALEDPSPRVRAAAALSLRGFTPGWTDQPLHQLMAPRDLLTRRSLRRHLGVYDLHVPIETLRRTLVDPSPAVRAAARRSWRGLELPPEDFS